MIKWRAKPALDNIYPGSAINKRDHIESGNSWPVDKIEDKSHHQRMDKMQHCLKKPRVHSSIIWSRNLGYLESA